MPSDNPPAGHRTGLDVPGVGLAKAPAQPAVLPYPDPEVLAVGSAGDALWGIIFAGGIGSRFWPLSSSRRPKQLLPLVDDRPLIADTVRRLRDVIPPERVLVMTSRDIAYSIHAAIPEVPSSNMLSEPAPMGTAASLAWGVTEIRRRAGADALVCATHADLAISFLQLFHNSLLEAAAAARRTGSIVLLGVQPTRTDTSFGHILIGGGPPRMSPLEASMAATPVESELEVERFIEKPSVADAEKCAARGALWHSGIFVASVRTIQREMAEKTPEVAAVHGMTSAGIPGIASSVESISIEHGLFERSTALKVLPTFFEWDDVGTWASLRRARELDDTGNGIVGTAYPVDSSANVVHTENGATVLFGVDNLVVVRLDDIAFVTTLERASDLRSLLDILPPELRRRVR